MGARILAEVDKDLRIRLPIQADVTHVSDDAHNLPRLRSAIAGTEVCVDLSTKGVRAQIAAARKRLIDKHHLRLSLPIVLDEPTPGDQTRPHRPQESPG
jgi:hypothetical protein